MASWRSTWQKRLAIPLLLLLVLSLVPDLAQSELPGDIHGHWAGERIQSWLDRDLAAGYPDGTFRPDGQVTRAEFVAFMNRAYDVPESGSAPGFSDVPGGHWSYRHVAAAAQAGLVTGYPDGTFGPENAITRQEAAAIVNRLLELDQAAPNPAPQPFSDQGSIAPWAADAVSAAAAAGMVTGYPDGTFRPRNPITRAESVSVLDRGLKPVTPQQPAAYQITFLVRDADGESLEGAAVALNGRSAATDADGKAVFADVAPGDYTYNVSREGYGTVRSRLVVSADRTVEVTLVPPAPVQNAQELRDALADRGIDHIVLAADIEADIAVRRSLTIDLGGHTLEGNVVFEHSQGGTSELLGTGEPSISGNLTVETPDASFINNVQVAGNIAIRAVAPNSYTENADGNSITISARGITITFSGNPADVSITGRGGDIVIHVAAGAQVEIEVHGSARNVTVIAAEGAKVVLTGDGAENVASEGEGEVGVKEDTAPVVGGGGGGGGGAPPSPPPSTPDPDKYTVTFVEGNQRAGVSIQIYSDSARTKKVGSAVTTGSDGKAQRDLIDGSYWYTATRAGYHNRQGNFTVAGTAQTVNFTMEALPPGSIAGTITTPGTGLAPGHASLEMVWAGGQDGEQSPAAAGSSIEGASEGGTQGAIGGEMLGPVLGRPSGSYANGSSMSWAESADIVRAAGNYPAIPAGSPGHEGDENDYLIGFRPAPLSAQADAMDVLSDYGGEVYVEFDIIDAVGASLPEQAVEALLESPAVEYVEPDQEVYAMEQVVEQSTGQDVPWGVDRVFGDEVYPFGTWNTTTGANIGVAVLDTGIDEEHEDLPTLSGGTTTVDSTHWGSDVDGHGTHVAGTIAALDNEIGVVGVSPGVDLYAVKVLDDFGSGYESDVIKGIEWAVSSNIPIINMSLGGPGASDAFRDACNAAYDEGHLLVAAAGNEKEGVVEVTYPARYESVIAVAASNEEDELADFSLTGPEVELIAPGHWVMSTLPNDKYGKLDGTSMAAPHVSAVAALAWSVNTGFSNQDIRDILVGTAEDLDLPDDHQGFGLVRADQAVAEANKEPLVNTEVTFSATNGSFSITVTTDGDGAYVLNDIPVGTYDITASAAGYQDATVQGVIVATGKQTSGINVHLLPVP